MTRIIHFRNIARVPRYLADAQRRLGHTSDVFSFHVNPYDVGADIQLDIEKAEYMPHKSVKVMREFWKIAKKYDIIHFHISSVMLEGIDIPLWKLIGKRTFIHHHGSEIRGKKEKRLYSLYSDGIFVVTPDLLKWSPSAIWIPNPIDTNYFEYIGVKEKKNEPIIIVHAPTNRAEKGTEHILKTIENLNENGFNINFKMVEKMPYFEAIKIYKNADIIIDQVKSSIGCYGMLSIECMAFGKPVICTINESYRSKYFHELPIVNCEADTLESKLVSLIQDFSLREELGKRGRQYIMNKHDSNIVAKMLIDNYHI